MDEQSKVILERIENQFSEFRKQFDQFETRTDKRFDRIEDHLTRIDSRFERVDARLDSIRDSASDSKGKIAGLLTLVTLVIGLNFWEILKPLFANFPK